MSSELKTTIIYELENVFGRKIVSLRDCMELSEDIFIKTQHRLNPNTLRRFFNLVKAEYPPSKSTLTILANYCGFQSTNDIYKVKNTGTLDAGILNADNVLHFLISLFKDDATNINCRSNHLSITKNVIKFLNTNKFLTDRFQSMVAKLENGRTYYYEQSVNIDKLNSFYGNGLRYYLLEKGTIGAEVFTASLYLFKYWLSAEDEKLIKIAENLLEIEIIEKLPPFTLARQLAGMLFYNNVTKKNNEALLFNIHNAYIDITTNKANLESIQHFTFIICNALLLTGYHKEALLYINNTKILLDDNKNQYLNQDYLSLYFLLEAYAYFNSGNLKEASSLFEQIKSSEFPFLSRKFSCILYISLLQKIKPKQNVKNEEQLIAMINETGFKRLKTL